MNFLKKPDRMGIIIFLLILSFLVAMIGIKNPSFVSRGNPEEYWYGECERDRLFDPNNPCNIDVKREVKYDLDGLIIPPECRLCPKCGMEVFWFRKEDL